MSQKENQREIPSATLAQLQKPEKLQNLLQQDKQDDCLSCRLTGATAFVGLGVYSYFSGKYHLQQQEATILRSGSRFGMKPRHAGIASVALALVGMGLYRLAN